MNGETDSAPSLVQNALAGDRKSLAMLFEQYRDRLKRMVELRIDGRLNGRVDASDVLQEAYIDLTKKLDQYRERNNIPFFLWVRMVTGERLLQIHRRHLNAEKRDVRLEVALGNRIPGATSLSLAEGIIGQQTSVSRNAIRVELRERLEKILNSMDETDREIIALRHFEELTNKEAAEILGLSKTACSNRYIRAIKRLRDTLNTRVGSAFN